ncbi:hypothetical protein IW137_001960, partial [Coemansia sp. RSA 1287]
MTAKRVIAGNARVFKEAHATGIVHCSSKLNSYFGLMSSNDPGSSSADKQSGAPRRKPAKRAPRAFVEEPLYLLPAHYVLLQDSTYELMRGLGGLSTAVEDDPLYFDQLLGAA